MMKNRQLLALLEPIAQHLGFKLVPADEPSRPSKGLVEGDIYASSTGPSITVIGRFRMSASDGYWINFSTPHPIFPDHNRHVWGGKEEELIDALKEKGYVKIASG